MFKRIDVQDVLLVAGVCLIVGGIAAWSRAAASIVLGLFCLLFVFTIARSGAPNKPEKL
jgi:hypothetical protein